jgi:hypothetical protein
MKLYVEEENRTTESMEDATQSGIKPAWEGTTEGVTPDEKREMEDDLVSFPPTLVHWIKLQLIGGRHDRTSLATTDLVFASSTTYRCSLTHNGKRVGR